jgi:hypothetical protein
MSFVKDACLLFRQCVIIVLIKYKRDENIFSSAREEKKRNLFTERMLQGIRQNDEIDGLSR